MDNIPLLKLMSADIAQQRAEIQAAASREAEEIGAQSVKTGEQRYGSAIALVDSELQAMSDRSRGRAEAESYMVLMTTKDTIADELLASLEKEMSEIAASPKFGDILDSLLQELMQEGPADGVVFAPQAHLARCQNWLAQHGYSHRVEAANFLNDGVAVQDASSSFRITNTLSARYEKQKSALRKHCIERLFDKGTQA